jgi:hypothetical protein
MHGGKGSGAPRGNRNGWKHGGRSAWIREVARYLRATSPAATARLAVDLAGPTDAIAPPLSLGEKEKTKKRTHNPMHPEMGRPNPTPVPSCRRRPASQERRAPSYPRASS